MSTIPAVLLRQQYVRDLWAAYLNPCCNACHLGTADCDVNPLVQIPSTAEIALRLMKMGQCP